MIELQRLKMLQQSGGRGGMPGHSPVAVSQGRNVPQQTAVSSMQTEDQQMQRFLTRMQRRDDSQQLISDTTSGPTVPTALSRRMLQRQGVGYLDDTVAAIASASADRFLATVLHQAVACRDQRLKGIEMARESKRHRKRHIEQYEADTDDRRRRKQERAQQREKANLAAIAAADSLKKGGNAASKKGADGTTKTKKTKKKKDAAADDKVLNGNKKSASLKKPDEDDDEESYDSLDEEEEFYQKYYGDPGDSDDSDEEDETLRLADIERPLEAWDFHITGKLGLDSAEAESEDEESDDEKEEDDQAEENGEEDGYITMKDANTEKEGDGKLTIEDGASTPKRPTKPAAKTTPPNQS